MRQVLKKESKDKEYLIEVIMAMSMCHTVIWDEKKQQYTAASPDELALVNAAKQFGYEFLGKNSDDVLTIKTPDGLRYYKELNVCEFTSTRKRQSNIFQELDMDGKTLPKKKFLICKGADSVIAKLLAPGQGTLIKDTNKYVTEFAEEGLRTLFLAKKELDDEFYHKWNAESE